MLDLTYRGEEDDGEEIPDWLDASRDLRRNHVTLSGQQSSGQETSQLHGNIQKVCRLQCQSARKTINTKQLLHSTTFAEK